MPSILETRRRQRRRGLSRDSGQRVRGRGGRPSRRGRRRRGRRRWFAGGGLYPRMAQSAPGAAHGGRRSLPEAECRFADYAHHSRVALDHRGRIGTRRQLPPAQPQTGQHPIARRLRIADHHRALRLFQSRLTDRSADQRPQPGRRSTCSRSRMPTSRPPIGIRANLRSSPMPKCRCYPRPRPAQTGESVNR